MTLQTYENFPVDTPRHFNVYKTSTRRCQRRIDVLQTLKQRCVSTEFLEYLLQLLDYLSAHPHYCAFYAAMGIAFHCHIHQQHIQNVSRFF